MGVIKSLRGIIIKAGTAIVVIWLLSWVFGQVFTPFAAVVVFVALAGLSLAVTQVGEFSTTFAISMVVVAVVLLEVLGVFLPVDAFLADVLPAAAGINRLRLAFYGLVVISVYWVIDIRVVSAFRRESGRPEASNPDTVARAFQRRATALLDDWRGVFVAIVVLGFVVLQSAFGVIGDAGGQVAAELARIPVLSAAVTTVALGYANLGGNIPVVSGLPLFGTLTAGEFLFISAALVLVAYFIREARS